MKLNKNNIKTICWLLLSLFVTFLIIFVAYRIWELDLNVFPLYTADGWLGNFIITSLHENGLIGDYFVDRAGAPMVSTLVETPFFDFVSLFEYLTLDAIFDSASAAMHSSYFLSFPLSALTMYILSRKLTKNNYISFCISIIFAITPYHFNRGYLHATLSNYFIIPVIIYICFLFIEEEYGVFLPKRYKENKAKSIIYILAIVTMGFSTIYYAFFALLCMFVALLVKMINTKKISHIFREGLSIALCGLSIFVSLLPNIIYNLTNGNNSNAVFRAEADSEYYAMKIIQLILPCMYNNVPFLKNITAKYNENTYFKNESFYSSLGFVGAVGFIIACVIIFIFLSKKVASSINVKEEEKKSKFTISDINMVRVNFSAFLILVLVLYGDVGGIGTIISYYVTPVFRSINRLSIVIECLSLCIITIMLDALINNIKSKKLNIICYLLIAVSLIFTIYSEVPYKEKDYQLANKYYDLQLRDFFGKVEADAGEGAMIFNAPYIEFPEGGARNDMVCYDQAAGYVYTKTLRWSFGSIRGDNDFAKFVSVDDCISRKFVELIKSYGFSGLCIDVYGYDDYGVEAISFYKDELGLEPIVSADERFYYFNISGV